jgi:hypothetical protein
LLTPAVPGFGRAPPVFKLHLEFSHHLGQFTGKAGQIIGLCLDLGT